MIGPSLEAKENGHDLEADEYGYNPKENDNRYVLEAREDSHNFESDG